MSYNDGNLLRDQSSIIDTREPDYQTGSEQNKSRRPVMSSLLYQALFSPEESSSPVQGNGNAYEIKVQEVDGLSWNNQSYPPLSDADSREWSSFSDISKAISPAAVNDAESDLLGDQASAEADHTFEVEPVELPPLEDQLDQASACMIEPGPEERLSQYIDVQEEASNLESRNQATENQPENPLTSYPLAQVRLSGHLPASEHQGVCQTINNECFMAAINERTKSDLRGKVISKLKQIKEDRRCRHSYSSALKHEYYHYNQQQQESQPELVSEQSPCSPILPGEPAFVQSSVHCVVSSSESIYIAPKSPSVTSASSDKSGTSSKSNNKSYRYNQTAAALQKSGLFKTTAKTAELLQKNRVLQQELQKLRRETMLFMHSVLANPENEHLRKLYLNQNPGLS